MAVPEKLYGDYFEIRRQITLDIFTLFCNSRDQAAPSELYFTMLTLSGLRPVARISKGGGGLRKVDLKPKGGGGLIWGIRLIYARVKLRTKNLVFVTSPD